MYGLTNFKNNRNDINWYRLRLSETPYTRRGLLDSFSIFQNFMKTWNCSLDMLCYLLDDIGVTDNHLFEYTIFEGDFLVAEHGVYITKQVKCGYYNETKDVQYNVYITENQYAPLFLSKVAKRIVEDRYPMLLEAPFLKREKRFKDNINELPLSSKVYLGDIDAIVLSDNNITINDLIKLYTDKSYKDSYIDKPIWDIYSDSDYIYFRVDETKVGYTLSVATEQFFNGDWESVENYEVHSICLYGDNGELIKNKWFSGKQKDAPYFNSPIVEAVKKIVLSNNK